MAASCLKLILYLSIAGIWFNNTNFWLYFCTFRNGFKGSNHCGSAEMIEVKTLEDIFWLITITLASFRYSKTYHFCLTFRNSHLHKSFLKKRPNPYQKLHTYIAHHAHHSRSNRFQEYHLNLIPLILAVEHCKTKPLPLRFSWQEPKLIRLILQRS